MEYEEKEEYILLGFKDKIDQRMFAQEKLFFKIINLDTPNPLIQIGNHVYTAKFDNEILGTSLLFQEQDELLPQDVYGTQTNIHLEFIAQTDKYLTLQSCKTPEQPLKVDPKELVDLQFKYSYDEVLDQLDEGSLDINDIVKRPNDRKLGEFMYIDTDDDGPSGLIDLQAELQLEAEKKKKETPVIDEDLQLLKDIIHQQANDPEYYNAVPEDDFQTEKEYLILKEIFLKSLDYTDYSQLYEHLSISQYVNLQGSIDSGIIEMKATLDEEDRKKLFSLENFDNFSVRLKIIVLTDYLREEKIVLQNQSKIELAQEDEFGRTPKQRYNMVKSLLNDMKYNLFIMNREKDVQNYE